MHLMIMAASHSPAGIFNSNTHTHTHLYTYTKYQQTYGRQGVDFSRMALKWKAKDLFLSFSTFLLI